jgi:acyl-CoA oxidase
MVKNFTQTPASGDVDASVNQRLAKAITDTFVTVAAHVREVINNRATLPLEDAKVVGCLYRLVRLVAIFVSANVLIASL